MKLFKILGEMVTVRVILVLLILYMTVNLKKKIIEVSIYFIHFN
jgi:hypothetical protein